MTAKVLRTFDNALSRNMMKKTATMCARSQKKLFRIPLVFAGAFVFYNKFRKNQLKRTKYSSNSPTYHTCVVILRVRHSHLRFICVLTFRNCSNLFSIRIFLFKDLSNLRSIRVLVFCGAFLFPLISFLISVN